MAEHCKCFDVISQGGKTVATFVRLRKIASVDSVEFLRPDLLLLAQSECETLELDLRKVEFLSIASLRLLVELNKSLQGRSVALQVRLSRSLREVFEVTKFDRLFSVIDEN